MIEKCRESIQHVRVQHPAAAANRHDRIGPDHSPDADQEGIAATIAELGDADTAGQLAATDNSAGPLGESEKNSPLLCAQVPEGVCST